MAGPATVPSSLNEAARLRRDSRMVSAKSSWAAFSASRISWISALRARIRAWFEHRT